MTMLRSQQKPEDTWDVTPLFSNLGVWEQTLKNAIPSGMAPHWKEIFELKGKLGENSANIKKVFDLYFHYSRLISKLYTFAHLKHDEDLGEDTFKGAYKKATSVYYSFQEETSWIEPELLSLPNSYLDSLLKDKDLSLYHFYLERLFRLKPHILSEKEEELVAKAAKSLSAPQKAFAALNNADFVFGTVKDANGNEKELTHGTYGLFLRDQDRVLRKNAFHTLYETYGAFENTISELLSGHIDTHVFDKEARGYKSCLQTSLFPKNIPETVYTSLINAAREKLPLLHRYHELRKQIMGLDELHSYDLYTPLVPNADVKFSYDEAVDLVIASVAPLGSEYQETLKKGLKEQRWVDKFENKGKRSGAYSSGCFDSYPYILMNFNGTLHDVFTLAHEAGHSMHSYLSHKNQPYPYADYPIFLAEVASTFNEALLHDYLLKTKNSPDLRLFLINEQLEAVRTTFFRQVMFAEFELAIHQTAENKEPLTPTTFKTIYANLLEAYFGKSVVIDECLHLEWSRIPHFYSNFYVYQYATGISAAWAFFEKVKHGGANDRNAYLEFLKSGSSNYPIEILKKAGVDMAEKEPIISALDKFGSLLETFEAEFSLLFSKN